MRIRTITCHHVYNHGAYLQAYALVAYLRACRHDVKIINYRPYYLRNHFNLWHSEEKYKRIGLGWLYVLIKLPQRLVALKRKRVFDNFYNKYIPVTEHEYLTHKELQANPPVADCYIAGSDQIWNTLFRNGTDPGFYLNFGNNKTKRISYAASFATSELADGSAIFVKEHLNNFDAISVRESSGLKILNTLGYKGVEVVDPVFLINKDEWENITTDVVNSEKYLLIYDFEKNADIKVVAKRISKQQNLKIYSVGSRKLSYAHRNYININPFDFVTLIKNASVVISNSFHGTAFAMIFHKPFFVINRIDGLNIRMEDLLYKYGLSSRIISSKVSDDELIKVINYSQIENILNQEIDKSKQFLATELS